MAKLTINGTTSVSLNLPDQQTGIVFPGQAFSLSIDGSTDITGCSISLDVQGNIFSTANGGIYITDALNGLFHIVAQKISLAAGSYTFKLLITLPSRTVKTYITGYWTITSTLTTVKKESLIAITDVSNTINVVVNDVDGVNKYVQTFDISAGSNTTVTTSIPTLYEPFSVMILSSAGVPLTDQVNISAMTVTGGVYVFTVYSSDAFSSAKLKILY